MGGFDPHSLTEWSQSRTRHIALRLYLDFPSSTINATVLIATGQPPHRPILLRHARPHHPLHPESSPRSPSPSPNPLHPLPLALSGHASFLITYTTSPSSSALQWLLPPQTFAKSHPFVYTQCQAIHARSVFPCQDTPAVRICYSALLNIPPHLSAVMAARHLPLVLPREGRRGVSHGPARSALPLRFRGWGAWQQGGRPQDQGLRRGSPRGLGFRRRRVCRNENGEPQLLQLHNKPINPFWVWQRRVLGKGL